MNKTCRECGKVFEAEQDYFYMCPTCYEAARDMICQQTNLNGTKCQRHATSTGHWKYCTQHWNDIKRVREQMRFRNRLQRIEQEQPIALPADNWLRALVKGEYK